MLSTRFSRFFSFFSAFKIFGCALFLSLIFSFASLCDDLPYLDVPYYKNYNSAKNYGSYVDLSDGNKYYFLVTNSGSEDIVPQFARLSFYQDGTAIRYIVYVPDDILSLYPHQTSYGYTLSTSYVKPTGSTNGAFYFDQLADKSFSYTPVGYKIYDSYSSAYDAVIGNAQDVQNIIYDSSIQAPLRFRFLDNGFLTLFSSVSGYGAVGSVVWDNSSLPSDVYCRLLVAFPDGDYIVPLVDFSDRMTASVGTYDISRRDIYNKFVELYPDVTDPAGQSYALRDIRIQFYTYDATSDIYSVGPISDLYFNTGGILGIYNTYISSIYYPVDDTALGNNGGFGSDFFIYWSNVGGKYVGYNEDSEKVSEGDVTSDIAVSISSNSSSQDAIDSFNNNYYLYQYNISVGGGSGGDPGGSGGSGVFPDLYGLLVSWMRQFSNQLASLESIAYDLFSSVSEFVGGVPEFFSDAFSFLPEAFSSLLMISLTICVILRFLGR